MHQEDLNDISEDIELKSKLIERLEMTKERMGKMRKITSSISPNYFSDSNVLQNQ